MVMHTFSPELANSLLYDRAEAKLLNPTIVGLLHRNNVAVDAQLLANARKTPESTDDVAANRGLRPHLSIPDPPARASRK
jgi:hypothetical protein